MSTAHSLAEEIHGRAIEAASRFRRVEADLVEIIAQAEAYQVHIRRGHASLFAYVNDEMRIAENSAYVLITVARKTREVPALLAQLHSGAITLSNARRISPVLTRENQEEWLTKARDLSSRQLEKEIVRVYPRAATREMISYVTPERVQIEVGMSEHEAFKLRRAQDLLSQSERRPVTLEETIAKVTDFFLRRHDPVEKAQRSSMGKGAASAKAVPSKPIGQVGELVTRREPIPAEILHRVRLRDQGRCVHRLADGSRCNQMRWLEVHHVVPVSDGGAHEPENLVTLCSAHHKYAHLSK